MRRTDFHFELPKELIAQRPAEERSASRLLVVDGATGRQTDSAFKDLPSLLNPGDLLVFNDTRVVPARVHGLKESGGKIEILLERALDANTALAQVRASKGLKPQARVSLPGGVTARMLGREGDLFRLRFSTDVLPYFEAHGEMPLPPYVDRAPESADRERYQTVYARAPGAVAAPTAGLHFDTAIFAALAERQVKHVFVTLHVGAGTFQPVRVDDLEGHVMHEEYLEVSESTAAAINATRAAGGRVIAVGTTVVRCLETVAGVGRRVASPAARSPIAPASAAGGAPNDSVAGGAAAGAAAAAGGYGATRLAPYKGPTSIFIKPGYEFQVVDAMVTNFHLPESTLLMLCAAFVGRDTLLAAYAHAIAARYRFFSYGDAMFLTPRRSSPGAAQRA
ncbi:MAG: S-adenosylmethionine:tRNA ribosyltransferase-isomerase [Gammaproteobacteria bacterium]|nr:S-adenosylmethionine:tRNA ribosyltransferase-isomerase [Gammaproteobacteria bacterium]